MKSRHFFCILFFLALTLSSCLSTRKAISFDINSDLTTNIPAFNTEVVIQKNDLLGITVSSRSADQSALYNAPTVVAGSGISAVPGGYLVNEDGNIQFPVLGTIKVAGLTKTQLQQNILKMLLDRKELLEPVVSVRNLNYRVTVLGEVKNPSVVYVPSERINILEAIGYAGDLTLYSDRSSVLLIRDENNQRNFKILNLNSNEIFTSPYFNLKPNDIIYVKPNKVRINDASLARQWLPILISSLSLAVIVVDRIILP